MFYVSWNSSANSLSSALYCHGFVEPLWSSPLKQIGSGPQCSTNRLRVRTTRDCRKHFGHQRHQITVSTEGLQVKQVPKIVLKMPETELQPTQRKENMASWQMFCQQTIHFPTWFPLFHYMCLSKTIHSVWKRVSKWCTRSISFPSRKWAK